MPIPASARQRPLEVRSNTLVGASAPEVTTLPGTMDTGARASFPGSADAMPAAKGFLNIPGGSGAPRVTSEHLSWSALQGGDPPGNLMAGAGGADVGGSIGEPQHMPGVVPQNKPPF